MSATARPTVEQVRDLISNAAWMWANRPFEAWGGPDGQDVELENAMSVVLSRTIALGWEGRAPFNNFDAMVAVLTKIHGADPSGVHWLLRGDYYDLCASNPCEVAALLQQVTA